MRKKSTRFIYLLSFFIGNIQVNIDFYVRVRAYEKRVTGKHPLLKELYVYSNVLVKLPLYVNKTLLQP